MMPGQNRSLESRDIAEKKEKGSGNFYSIDFIKAAAGKGDEKYGHGGMPIIPYLCISFFFMPTLLKVENLARSYGEKILFENISFVINQFQKVALIARNGAGKTSLLNIIAGTEPSDEGTVTLFSKASMQYLQQEPELSQHTTVFEEVYSTSNEIQRAILDYERVLHTQDKKAIEDAIEKMDACQGWEYETRIKQILTRLKLPDFGQPMAELSGGQRKRVALAKILITEPDFLILDEPTNHLDVEMIEWLEEYLLQRSLTIFMVTHDRYFLDRVCDEILEMDEASVFRYKGNYSYFLDKQAERIEIRNKETEKARNLLRNEREWMSRMPKARTTKSKARIESFYEIKDKAENVVRQSRINISVAETRLGRKILEMNDVSFSWKEQKILKGFTYTFKRAEKIGIIGNNGSGKSTFLEIVTQALKPQRGAVQKGETINFGYYRQEGIRFNEQTKVVDVVRDIAEVVKLENGDTISSEAFLNFFMFPYGSLQQPVYKLSGGEKRRLYLVTVLMKNPNFLILDEPTNDLDILTLNILEEYLAAFNGCVLVVTHDRYFLDKIVDHLFVFEGDGIVKDFPGNYTIYKEYHDRKVREELSKTRSLQPRKEKPKQAGAAKPSFKEQREFEGLEKEITSLEQRKKEVEDALHSGTLKPEELVKMSEEFGKLLDLIDAKTGRWIELSEKF
jgi:ABC transport system ATP-binding/permease protein